MVWYEEGMYEAVTEGERGRWSDEGLVGGGRLRRQISLDYYTIPPATQANKYIGFEVPMNI